MVLSYLDICLLKLSKQSSIDCQVLFLNVLINISKMGNSNPRLMMIFSFSYLFLTVKTLRSYSYAILEKKFFIFE